MTISAFHGSSGGRWLPGGYSLEDAARMHRAYGRNIPAVCPACGGTLRDLTGHRPSGDVRLVQCRVCRRGLVFDRPPDG